MVVAFFQFRLCGKLNYVSFYKAESQMCFIRVLDCNKIWLLENFVVNSLQLTACERSSLVLFIGSMNGEKVKNDKRLFLLQLIYTLRREASRYVFIHVMGMISFLDTVDKALKLVNMHQTE